MAALYPISAARLVRQTVSRTLSMPVPAISSLSDAACLATISQRENFSSMVSMTLSPVEPHTT